MAKTIMIQGTMSNAGKTILTAGLCRVFHQEGYSVAPFKSQNMALNSFITQDGLEMSRAQAVQAEAARVAPSVFMNPVLLKPVTDMGAEVVVHGKSRGTMSAADYFASKTDLVGDIMNAFNALASAHDIIVIEGAGSPAEINLKENDIVNMGLAKMTDTPVLLVGDINRGGVFAQLVGTLELLDPDEKDRVKGMIINKFRGDVNLLRPGLDMLEAKTGKKVIGTMPYLTIDIEDEDSLTDRFGAKSKNALLDIAVIRFPKISNFTDFMPLEATNGVQVRYISNAHELGQPDMVVLPGTQDIIADLKWLRQNGLEAEILRLAAADTVIFGICGGYQMLGKTLQEADNPAINGLGLLPLTSEIAAEQTSRRLTGKITGASGTLSALNGCEIKGYEVHLGTSSFTQDASVFVTKDNGESTGCAQGNIAGANIHEFFEADSCRAALIEALCAQKGIAPPAASFDLAAYKNAEFDKLADAIRENLDMELIYKVMGISR